MSGKLMRPDLAPLRPYGADFVTERSFGDESSVSSSYNGNINEISFSSDNSSTGISPAPGKQQKDHEQVNDRKNNISLPLPPASNSFCIDEKWPMTSTFNTVWMSNLDSEDSSEAEESVNALAAGKIRKEIAVALPQVDRSSVHDASKMHSSSVLENERGCARSLALPALRKGAEAWDHPEGSVPKLKEQQCATFDTKQLMTSTLNIKWMSDRDSEDSTEVEESAAKLRNENDQKDTTIALPHLGTSGSRDVRNVRHSSNTKISSELNIISLQERKRISKSSSQTSENTAAERKSGREEKTTLLKTHERDGSSKSERDYTRSAKTSAEPDLSLREKDLFEISAEDRRSGMSVAERVQKDEATVPEINLRAKSALRITPSPMAERALLKSFEATKPPYHRTLMEYQQNKSHEISSFATIKKLQQEGKNKGRQVSAASVSQKRKDDDEKKEFNRCNGYRGECGILRSSQQCCSRSGDVKEPLRPRAPETHHSIRTSPEDGTEVFRKLRTRRRCPCRDGVSYTHSEISVKTEDDFSEMSEHERSSHPTKTPSCICHLCGNNLVMTGRNHSNLPTNWQQKGGFCGECRNMHGTTYTFGSHCGAHQLQCQWTAGLTDRQSYSDALCDRRMHQLCSHRCSKHCETHEDCANAGDSLTDVVEAIIDRYAPKPVSISDLPVLVSMVYGRRLDSETDPLIRLPWLSVVYLCFGGHVSVFPDERNEVFVIRNSQRL